MGRRLQLYGLLAHTQHRRRFGDDEHLFMLAPRTTSPTGPTVARFLSDSDVERLEVLSRGLDGLVVMLLNSRRGIAVREHVVHKESFYASFTGGELIAWMLDRGLVQERRAAFVFASLLLSSNLVARVGDALAEFADETAALYQFTDAARVRAGVSLQRHRDAQYVGGTASTQTSVSSFAGVQSETESTSASNSPRVSVLTCLRDLITALRAQPPPKSEPVNNSVDGASNRPRGTLPRLAVGAVRSPTLPRLAATALESPHLPTDESYLVCVRVVRYGCAHVAQKSMFNHPSAGGMSPRGCVRACICL
jgi:hypothetical protein